MKYLFILCFVALATQINAQAVYSENASSLGIQTNFDTTGYFGGGVSFCDFDGNGFDDLSFATASGEELVFYSNTGTGFVQVSLGITDTSQVKQINWVDIDNDGDQDLFLTRYESYPSLYENTGNMVMNEITFGSGQLMGSLKTFGASWGDFDNDGYLDVLICIVDGDWLTGNLLFLNNGDNTFTDITVPSGIQDFNDLSFCAALVDYDLDGLLDIFIANDKLVPNELFRNNGNLTFTDVSIASGMDTVIDAMTATLGDYNADGYPDYYVTNTHDGSILMRNNANGTFTDIADSVGVGFESIGWGAVFLDGDNDMDLDLYVSGMLAPSSGYLPSAYYDRSGVDTFEIVTTGFEADSAKSFSNAIGDLNNDGFPDFAVNNLRPIDNFVYEATANSNHWVKIDLEGTISNRNGVGARIEVAAGGMLQYNFVLLGEGFLGQNSFSEFFGLGPNTSIDSITVFWPSGHIDVMYNTAVDQRLDLVEGFSVTGLSAHDLEEMKLYPNPSASGVYRLELTDISKPQKIYVTDFQGRVVKDLPLVNEQQVDLSAFARGTYFVHVLALKEHYAIQLIR